MFRLPGQRQRYRCVEVRGADVLAFGGSPDPGGKKGMRSFALDLAYIIVKEKQDA
jgi:hypothetical protein